MNVRKNEKSKKTEESKKNTNQSKMKEETYLLTLNANEMNYPIEKHVQWDYSKQKIEK